MTNRRALRAGIFATLFGALAACVQLGQVPNDTANAAAQKGLPEDANVQLYLLIGQSNMAGRGEVAEIDRETHPRVYMLDADNLWQPARDPIHFDKPDRVGVGLGLTFGKSMAQANPGAVIGLIPSAVGGSQIAAWTPGGYYERTDVHPYDDAIARTRVALASGGQLAAILWHQGEYDSRRDQAPHYAQALSGLVARLRRDLGAPDVPILVGGLGDFLLHRNTDAHQVQHSLKAAPETERHLGFVSAAGLRDKGDELHFDAASYREFGRRYAAALQAMRREVAE